MKKDRLEEFRQKMAMSEDRDYDDFYHREAAFVTVNMPEMDQFMNYTTTHDHLNIYFAKVDLTKQLIADLKINVDKIHHLHSTILSTPMTAERTKVELEELMKTVKSSTQAIRKNVKDLELDVGNSGEEVDLISTRIRNNLQKMLLRDFIDTMNKYQLEQANYRDQCEARIKRQFEISGLNCSGDEVEEMMDHGNLQVFTHQIITDNYPTTKLLADTQARHNNIIKCEKSITELRDLYIEMDILLESQGEILDRIEEKVDETRDAVKETNRELDEAKHERDKARKKKLLLFTICALLALPIWLTLFIHLL